MRMRKKPNLIPRLERCAHVLENSPADCRGSWLDAYPAFKEVHVELGCGKGRFTRDMEMCIRDRYYIVNRANFMSKSGG